MKAPDYELRAHDEPETRTEDMGHGFQTTEFENPAVLMTRRCRPGPSKLTDRGFLRAGRAAHQDKFL